MVILENRCIACGECRSACDFGELDTTGPLPVMNGRCKWCGACVDSCPTGARQIVGREMTVEDVLAEVQKDRVFFEESGGGVTFSGGEPFMQPAFLKALLTACRAAGFHTAVDTCGLAPLGEVLGIAPLADLLLYDLKSMDDGRHREFTGVSNGMILENLQALSRVHPHIWIRVPLIPGVNDDLPSLELMARLVRNLPGLHPVNVLPFHRTGRPKARRLGRTDRMEDISPPSAATVELAVSVFRRFGLDAKVGG